jgi:hypothetical protein
MPDAIEDEMPTVFPPVFLYISSKMSPGSRANMAASQKARWARAKATK